MGGGDVDAPAGRLLAAELRHPVEGLDGEDVGGVRQQPPHLQPSVQQAVLCRPVAHAVAAGQARTLRRAARRAPDRVAQVGPAAAVQRLVPLQAEGAVVHLGDDAARGGGGSCSHWEILRLFPLANITLSNALDTAGKVH